MFNQTFARLILATVFLVTATRATATPADEKGVESDIDATGAGTPRPPTLHGDTDVTPALDDPPQSRPPDPNDTLPDYASKHLPEPEHQPPPAEAQPIPKLDTGPAYDGTTRARTSSSGEPIFDWSKHQGEAEVQHPFAEKGLTRIGKDRTYYYKIKESSQAHAASFRAGIFHPTRLRNPDEAGEPGSTFDENYQSSSVPALMLDYEWQLWRTSIGKIGLKAGSGAFIAQGNGHFVVKNDPVNSGLTPREVFTFAVIPINVGPVYRFQFWHRQMFVPFVEGGGTLFGFTEFRDDNKPPKFGGSLGAYAGGGLALNLTYFDALSRIALDREYGINAVYLTVEYTQIVAITQRYDFTSDLINAGFLMEY